MIGVLALGGPLAEVIAQLTIWLYVVPLIFAMIGLKYLREAVQIAFAGRHLDAARRQMMAGYLAWQGALGLILAMLMVLAIFYRKELIQCVIALF